MAKISRLVNPSLWPAAIGSFLKKTLWPFIKKRWKWVLGGIALIALTLFIINALTPDKVVSPTTPTNIKEEQTKTVEDLKVAGDKVDETVQKTTDNQRDHQERIERVRNKPSRDVDEAIENWNEGL